MATTPTQLPVPSEKPQDLKFNAGKIDEFVTSMGWTYIDRFGNKHYTIEGINYLAQQAMSAFGYVTLYNVSFTTGATVSNPNEILFNEADNSYYKWSGSFATGPKVVPVNSTPETSGGVGPGKWLNVGDGAVRGALASTDDGSGDAMIGVKQPLAGAVSRTQHEKNAESISVKDFGAIGDGTLHLLSEKFSSLSLSLAKLAYPFVTSLTQSIDYAAIQSAINSCFTNKRKLYVPEGAYISSDYISVKSGNHFAQPGVFIYGEGVNASQIWFKNASDGFVVSPIVPGDSVYHVAIRDIGIMQLDNTGAMTEDGPGLAIAGDGIAFTGGSSHVFLDNLRINGFNRTIYFPNTWDSYCRGIIFGNCFDGIITDGGTTFELDNCYAYWTKGTAFKLHTIYSKVGALACDHSDGLPYDFEYFGGTVGSLGCEVMGAKPTDTIFKFGNSHVDVGYVFVLGLGNAKSLKTIFDFGGSKVSISKIEVQSGGTTTAVNAMFYKTYQSHIEFGTIYSNHTFSPINQTLNNDTPGSTVSFGGVKQNYGGIRPYLGSLGFEGQDIAQPGKDYTPPAFIFDCFGGFIDGGSDGEYGYGFMAGPRIGQWGVERRPDIHGVAAYIATNNSADNNGAETAVVPAILYTT